MSLVAAIPVLAYEGITDATVTPGTIDISTPTNLTVSFTTPVEIPSDGEVVIIFPYQFGLQEITGVTSSDIDGVLSSNVQTFTELHITRATDSAPVSFGSLIDDLVIENVTTPPILGWVGDYNVQVLDANGDVLAAGLVSLSLAASIVSNVAFARLCAVMIGSISRGVSPFLIAVSRSLAAT